MTTDGSEAHSHFNEKPWIKLIETIRPFFVWSVDGAFVRKYLQPEFTNFAQPLHPDFKNIIPPNELWIEVGSNPEEYRFFIENMLEQNRLMAQGMSYSRAEAAGIRVESRERHRTTFEGSRKIGAVNPEINMRRRVGPLEVWIVDGKKVRTAIDPRFCSGGHDAVYGYVPENHIWLDNTLPHSEFRFIEVHELGERKDMAMGYPYTVAHAKWSRIENQCRHDKNELLRQMKTLGIIESNARWGKGTQIVVSEAL